MIHSRRIVLTKMYTYVHFLLSVIHLFNVNNILMQHVTSSFLNSLCNFLFNKMQLYIFIHM